MLKSPSHHVPLPSPKEMLIGTRAFARVLAENPKVRNGMAGEVGKAFINGKSHVSLNKNQQSLLHEYSKYKEKPKYIAILVPGLQLDGKSLLGFQKSFNKHSIPAFFPDGLPYGWNAVFFRQHPDILVEKIVEYVQKIQKEYPEAEILLVGHSYGGTQVLHAAEHLGTGGGKVVPITVAGVLGEVGPMAQAGHAVYYRIPSHVFSGKDPFIGRAREIQGNQDGITVVDTKDGYLTTDVQAGVYADSPENNSDLIVSAIASPGHYKQGVDEYFSQYITDRVVKRLKEREQAMAIPQ